ncbi:hypothetical protein [Fimbriiglobus ruber]|uniref:Alpha-2-macroglobulin domain-containing protein n=1 Tax=Fimbriiglobus ruber TaxID=1908690 RepID=A0A225DT56_9BACT|nr:hypothetical protein [Fimbriiglobus ruber]OWK44511.1 hypothetical protein FRUB_02443 [Fimbriiglobus ruber]
MKKELAGLAITLAVLSTATAADVGFIESFALARDREASLQQLIPGTEDSYYYHALHYLNTEQFDKIEAITGAWHQRYNQTPRLTEIQTRYALLTYEKQQAKTLAYLKNRLGLRFDHQKEVVGAAPDLPVALDQKLISRDTLRANSFARWQGLDNFEDAALDWLSAADLTWQRRRNLLQRLQRPDVPNLPKLIVDDLTSQNAPGFGSYPVHAMLTLAQLDELVKLRPNLLNETAYVRAYVTKLQPGADDDWKRDRAVTRAYLERLQAFTDRLDPVHNALKAHVLYHRLAFDRAQGVYDAARFLAYLKLPRYQPYMARALNEKDESRRHPADLNADFLPITLLPRVGSDEPLVRSYLQHFFLTATSPKEYEPFVDDTYLKHLFAETKIENGLGDAEAWAAQLPPELFRAIKDRSDIDFAFTNKTDFATAEPVTLDLFVKNVPTLLVKVFEINTRTVYRTQLREVDTDINLDGLVANAEAVHKYDDPPLRRNARRFTFPEMTRPGVYVVDFIGAGKSSRALIRKGRLRPVVTTGTAGQIVRVVDDANKLVSDATVWVGGQEYKADPDGRIVVPFTTAPGRHPIVVSQRDFSSLDYLQHQPEAYRLLAGIHIDREALLGQRLAAVLVRPSLFLNSSPVSVKLLEDVRLRITSTDLNNISSSVEIPDFPLFEDRESVHEIRVPARLAALNVALTAKVKNLGTGQQVTLSAGETFALNEIDRTDKIEDLHFARFGDDYVVELLGRTGESKADRAVRVALKHRDFRELINVTLKSDARGRVVLGSLADIDSVTATGPEGTAHTWTPPTDHHTYRTVVHAKVGETITVPYFGTTPPARSEVALFEVRGSDIRADKFDALVVKDGMLELHGLTAGDYDLWLKRLGDRIRVRVTDGAVVAGHVLGKTRFLEVSPLKPVQIRTVAADADAVTIRLTGASKFTRVHLFATRYRPAYSAYADLGRIRGAELEGAELGFSESVYLTGRNIGDEYRYVLDRRGQKKFPGNMLERPMLLLNPWAVRSTETGEQAAAGGEMFGAKGGGGAGGVLGAPGSLPAPISPPAGRADFADLDFLADTSAVLLNLVPDKDGVVRVARKDVGPHALLNAVAVDPLSTTSRFVALPEPKTLFADLRLRTGLDPTKHYTQQKQVTILEPGKAFTIDDVAASRFEAYDSLPKVYSLYATLSRDPKLAEFAFVATWPKLKPEEKKAMYSKYACHELHFFLLKKDPAFFTAVVKPYLANKKDKTFLDRWFLADDVGRYLQSWEYGRLNTVERVLLAQKVAGEPGKTARHLNDLLRLLPPQTDRSLVLFDTALSNGELGRSDSLEYRSKRDEKQLMERKGDPQVPADQPGVGQATPPFGGYNGPGGMGGGRVPGIPTPAAAAKPQSADSLSRARDGRSAAAKDMAKKSEEMRELKSDKEKMVLEGLNAAEREGLFHDDDRAARGVVRQLYRKVDPTQEWAENNYYHLLIQQQVADLVSVNPFWRDYANHAGDGPFLSKNLADSSRNFTEMMFALSVLDLPFEAGKHDVKFDGGKMTLTPKGPVIAFHEEVRPVDGKGGQINILVSENAYRNGDRFREENGERHDKFVTGEFVVHTVYGCQVVVTNPTSSRQKLSVLVQLPVGAIPVANGQFTKTVVVDLEPYRTHTLDYLFYFPKPGRFAHFPAHVAKNEQFVAAAQATTFDVVEKPTKLDTTSWDYVSQHGTTDEVLAFLGRENVNALNLDKIAFRMRDRAAFEAVVTLLRERHVYQPTLWSYSLLHADVPATRQYLQHIDQIVNECAGPIVSPLLTIDPVERHQYEHLEYKPLVNARAHSLGKQRQIVNDRLFEQYHRYLKLLSYHQTLDDADELAVVYYLLLQDRVDEALTTFARVNPDKIPTRVQYDYCAAYLDLYTGEPLKAREVALRYANHPVDRWRNTFGALSAQLDEIEGKGPKVVDPTDRGQQQGQLAATEPGVEFTIDAGQINMTWQNADTARVNFYLMDVELLFSRNPFVQQSGGQFASIKPNATQVVKLPAGKTQLAVPLPADLVKRNVLVEITAGGVTRSKAYYANAMDVKVTENYGQVRVADAAGGAALPKVYVKVYAKLANGEVKFHKDGYTDLRGRFDYATVSTPERQPIERFAILVLSDDRGATIRDTAPPQQ